MNFLLVLIGTTLFGLAVVLILLGSFYTKKSTAEYSIGYKKKGVANYSIIPMRLKYKSKVEGELDVSIGELQFSLEDSFGWLPQPLVEISCPTYVSWAGHGKFNFEHELGTGDCLFMLGNKSPEVSAKLEWSVTCYVYYLKRLVDLGLVFVEVSVPLLVTGLVI